MTVVDEQTHLPSGAEITEIWTREAEDFDFERPRWNPSEFVAVESPLNSEDNKLQESILKLSENLALVFHSSVEFEIFVESYSSR